MYNKLLKLVSNFMVTVRSLFHDWIYGPISSMIRWTVESIKYSFKWVCARIDLFITAKLFSLNKNDDIRLAKLDRKNLPEVREFASKMRHKFWVSNKFYSGIFQQLWWVLYEIPVLLVDHIIQVLKYILLHGFCKVEFHFKNLFVSFIYYEYMSIRFRRYSILSIMFVILFLFILSIIIYKLIFVLVNFITIRFFNVYFYKISPVFRENFWEEGIRPYAHPAEVVAAPSWKETTGLARKFNMYFDYLAKYYTETDYYMYIDRLSDSYLKDNFVIILPEIIVFFSIFYFLFRALGLLELTKYKVEYTTYIMKLWRNLEILLYCLSMWTFLELLAIRVHELTLRFSSITEINSYRHFIISEPPIPKDYTFLETLFGMREELNYPRIETEKFTWVRLESPLTDLDAQVFFNPHFKLNLEIIDLAQESSLETPIKTKKLIHPWELRFDLYDWKSAYIFGPPELYGYESISDRTVDYKYITSDDYKYPYGYTGPEDGKEAYDTRISVTTPMKEAMENAIKEKPYLFDFWTQNRAQPYQVDMDMIYKYQFFLFDNLLIHDVFYLGTKLFFLILFLIFIKLMRIMVSSVSLIQPEQPFLVVSLLLFLLILLMSIDLNLLYMCFEAITIIIVVIIAHEYTELSVDAAVKYFSLNAIISGLFMFGVSILYGYTVSTDFLNIYDFFFTSSVIEGLVHDYVPLIFALSLLLISFLVKLGVWPGSLWVFDVYAGCTLLTLFLISVVLKVVVLFIFIRFLLFAFIYLFFYWKFVLLLSAIGSLLLSSIGLCLENKLNSFLAYSSIGQLGFVLLGLACYPSIQSLSSVLLYIFSYCTAISGVFMLLPIVFGRAYVNNNISKFIGLYRKSLIISFILTVLLASLSGLPPFLGFFTKYRILVMLFSSVDSISLILLVLFTTTFTTYGYFRLIALIWFNNLNTPSGSLGSFYTAQGYNVTYYKIRKNIQQDLSRWLRKPRFLGLSSIDFTIQQRYLRKVHLAKLFKKYGFFSFFIMFIFTLLHILGFISVPLLFNIVEYYAFHFFHVDFVDSSTWHPLRTRDIIYKHDYGLSQGIIRPKRSLFNAPPFVDEGTLKTSPKGDSEIGNITAQMLRSDKYFLTRGDAADTTYTNRIYRPKY